MQYKNTHLLSPGHRGCAGCGQLLAARHVVDALGKNTIVACATGCLEVTTTPYPESAWRVPWIHSLFENAPAVATGILSAIRSKHQGQSLKTRTVLDTNVAVFAGDGSTFDIGFGALSGLWTRRDNILYVCFDNEAYMNTGNQYSGATPYGSATETSPNNASLGNDFFKKNMPKIAAAHNVSYIATSTIGYPEDIVAKVKKSLTFCGPRYIQILVGCVPGWGYNPELTIELGRLAHQSGHYPVLEIENGKLSKVMKVPAKRPQVEEYLKPQKRFSHLFKTDCGKEKIKQMQCLADQNVERYGLV